MAASLISYLQDSKDNHLMAFDLAGHLAGKFIRGLDSQLTKEDFTNYGIPYNSFSDLLKEESPWLYNFCVNSVGSRAGKNYLKRHGKEHEDSGMGDALYHPTSFLAHFVGMFQTLYQFQREIIETSKLNKKLSKKIEKWEDFYRMLNEKISKVRVLSPDRND